MHPNKPPKRKWHQPVHPRLQRYLSECGVASRRSAEELIAAGKVTINGIVVTELGTRVDPDHSIVRVSNRIVKPAPKGVLLLHKPPGVVSTLSDPEGRRSIADYLTKHYRSYFPVGRLDWDSAGLVVLTNDGDLANHLLHPRFEVERVYHARVEGIPNKKTLEMLAKGVKLSDGPASCQGVILEVSGDHTWVEVSLAEGRNRIVRRLFDHVGHPVDKLKRVSHGPFRLGTLRPGDVRRLTEKEYLRLKRAVEMSSRREKNQEERSDTRGGREMPKSRHPQGRHRTEPRHRVSTQRRVPETEMRQERPSTVVRRGQKGPEFCENRAPRFDTRRFSGRREPNAVNQQRERLGKSSREPSRFRSESQGRSSERATGRREEYGFARERSPQTHAPKKNSLRRNSPGEQSKKSSPQRHRATRGRITR